MGERVSEIMDSNRKRTAWNSGWRAAAFLGALALTGCLSAASAEAQTLRRQARVQKRLEKVQEKQDARKLAPGGQPATPTPQHSLDGVAQNPGRLFSREEQSLVIKGFGRPAALLILFRQLDLTSEQKDGIRAIGRDVGTHLVELQMDQARLDKDLEEAIYGEAYDPKRVDELAAQVATRQGEIIKLRASIESRIRQSLTPDQLFVYRFFIGELLMPNRRIPQAQLRQQMLQRRPPVAGRPGVNPTVPPPDDNDDR